METFASLGAGLVAFFGAAAVLWKMGDSTRKENKADIIKLGDDTDRKIADVAQIIAKLGDDTDRKIADVAQTIAKLGDDTDRKIAENAKAIAVMREAQAKNTADIANLRDAIAADRANAHIIAETAAQKVLAQNRPDIQAIAEAAADKALAKHRQ